MAARHPTQDESASLLLCLGLHGGALEGARERVGLVLEARERLALEHADDNILVLRLRLVELEDVVLEQQVLKYFLVVIIQVHQMVILRMNLGMELLGQKLVIYQ